MAARETMNEYIAALVERGDFGRFFADDMEFSMQGSGHSETGAEAAEQAIRYMHEQAFEAQPELKNLIVDGERAAIEADFVGVHTGDFGGIPPTGKSVRVPYSVVYDLEGDKIKSLRIYMPMQALFDQLGAVPAEAGAAAT